MTPVQPSELLIAAPSRVSSVMATLMILVLTLPSIRLITESRSATRQDIEEELSIRLASFLVMG